MHNFLSDAVALAHKKGSRIINMSLGGAKSEGAWKLFSKAMQKYPDILFVVAAGNTGSNLSKSPQYPAVYEHANMLVVASVDENNKLSRSSNYSKIAVDVAAPGENISSLEPENAIGKKSGTSMAAPYVTRIAAKIKFINPSLSPRQIISIIRDSVTPIDSLRFKVKYGGVANEEKALDIARKSLH